MFDQIFFSDLIKKKCQEWTTIALRNVAKAPGLAKDFKKRSRTRRRTVSCLIVSTDRNHSSDPIIPSATSFSTISSFAFIPTSASTPSITLHYQKWAKLNTSRTWTTIDFKRCCSNKRRSFPRPPVITSNLNLKGIPLIQVMLRRKSQRRIKLWMKSTSPSNSRNVSRP